MREIAWPSVLVIDDKHTFCFDAAYARDIESAISLLDDDWHSVWFDYDLSHGTNVEPVLAWLVDQVRSHLRPVIHEVVIHTSNPRGADAIWDALAQIYPLRRLQPDEVQRLLATA